MEAHQRMMDGKAVNEDCIPTRILHETILYVTLAVYPFGVSGVARSKQSEGTK